MKMKVKFYKTSGLRENELSFCKVLLDCGILIKDFIVFKDSLGELKVILPKRTRRRENEKIRYNIVKFLDEKLWEDVEQAIREQWERYTKNWKI